MHRMGPTATGLKGLRVCVLRGLNEAKLADRDSLKFNFFLEFLLKIKLALLTNM